ncbi:MAG: hypothetical protein Fur0032_24530 [Terrimicrobiaceae bacterium]
MAYLQIQLPEGTSQTHELTDERTTIGRVEDNVLVIVHDSVSSHHAEIVQDGDVFRLRDLGSTNGTFVNSEPTTEFILQDGVEIRFGAVPATFVLSEKRSGSSQPLPESSAPSIEAANLSSRPSNFVCSSPIPRNSVTKDPIAIASYAVVVLGILAVVAGAVMALTMAV